MVIALNALLGVVAAAGLARDVVPAPSGPSFFDDPTLLGFVGQAMERRPELAAARATIRADREQVPQARALPDPTLTLGIQNDGFRAIQIGRMETSFLAVGAAQALPWPGKRGLRGEVAALGAAAAEADLRRAELSIRADVERAYLDLLLARDQLALLGRLESLWAQSEGLARVRYEAGEGSQSDLLRAQLERQRLRQQRWTLEAEERRRCMVLNRMRGEPLDAAVTTPRRLVDLPDPTVADAGQALLAAEASSPELSRAVLSGRQASRAVVLARRERWPDLTLSAGIMPRGGNFETMWQASVGVSVPLWSAQKQARAIAENEARGEAATSTADGIRQLLHQRIHERLATLRALVEVNRLYRSSLLLQSEATVSSSLLQYQVGRIAFASVLEALAGYLGDRNGFLDAIAAAQRIAIAERELSLEPPGGASAGAAGGASIPGAGSTAAPANAPAGVASAKAGTGATASMSRM